MADQTDPNETSQSLAVRLNSPTWKQRIEIVAAIIISIATVFSAWCAYQSRLWSGSQAAATNAAGAARATAGRLMNEALTQTTIDVLLFEQYAVAVSEDNARLAEFLRARFRDEFVPAFDAWLATEPITNPQAPESPFAMEAYLNASETEANELLSLAEQKAAEASEANAIGSRFVLYTVLFAMVMFFGGISLRVTNPRVRLMLFFFGTLIFLVAIAFVVTSPFRLT